MVKNEYSFTFTIFKMFAEGSIFQAHLHAFALKCNRFCLDQKQTFGIDNLFFCSMETFLANLSSLVPAPFICVNLGIYFMFTMFCLGDNT